MPLDRNVSPEPLGLAASYGLDQLGPKHASLSEIYDRIAAERNWWIATTSQTHPHVSPVWGLICEDRMIFCCDPRSLKATNLKNNPHVALHLESGDNVVIVNASASLIAPTELPTTFADDYEAKYAYRPDPDDPNFRAYELHPTKIMSWQEAEVVETAARWRF